MALREGVSRPCWGSVLFPASVFFIIILILIIVFVLCSGLIPVFITSGLLSATRGRGRGAGGGAVGWGSRVNTGKYWICSQRCYFREFLILTSRWQHLPLRL